MEPAASPLIALVDDDELFRRSLERFVRSAGFRVEAYGSGEDFLANGNVDGTACAILDVRMPGMDGLELQRRLIARPRRVPIVFVSAHDDAVMRADAVRAGAVAFLKKPFDDHTLLDALHRAISDDDL
jgi:FixJ family two-component response regulator